MGFFYIFYLVLYNISTVLLYNRGPLAAGRTYLYIVGHYTLLMYNINNVQECKYTTQASTVVHFLLGFSIFLELK